MITDVSTRDDFHQAGLAYLNLAWRAAIDLGLELHELNYDESDEVPDEYWHAAQRPLATATSLLQQGVEFLIKARIASVSPFLLIDGSPQDWPRGCQKKDTPFSAFKTLDAQDLIRAHDTVHTERFDDEFVNRYEQLRNRRNAIMHTVDRTLRFTATEVLSLVLEFNETFVGAQQWVKVRAEGIEEEPSTVAYWGLGAEPRIARELLYAIDVLKPAQLKRHFGFNARQRKYYCYKCQMAASDWDLRVTTAQLKPNKPTSTTLYCFVCQSEAEVIREPCEIDGCNGNVLDATDRECLTCYGDAEIG